MWGGGAQTLRVNRTCDFYDVGTNRKVTQKMDSLCILCLKFQYLNSLFFYFGLIFNKKGLSFTFLFYFKVIQLQGTFSTKKKGTFLLQNMEKGTLHYITKWRTFSQFIGKGNCWYFFHIAGRQFPPPPPAYFGRNTLDLLKYERLFQEEVPLLLIALLSSAHRFLPLLASPLL